MGDNTAAIAAVNEALDAAYLELAVRREDERRNPTPSTRAAVSSLEERVRADQSKLAALMRADVRPVAVSPPVVTPITPTPSPPVLIPVPIGNPIPTPLPVTSEPKPPVKDGPPVPLPTSELPGLTSAQTQAFIAANILGDDETIAQFIDKAGNNATAEDAWNYLVDQVDSVFTELEGSFESLSASALESGTAISVVEIGAGVTADIGSIEVVGFAAATLLGEYIIGWIITEVGRHFPNPSIFGWHPLAFITDGLVFVGTGLQTSAKTVAGDIGNVFIQPVRQLVGLVQRIFNSTASAHNKVATLHTTTIPQSRHEAVVTSMHYTDAAVATLTTQLTGNLAQLKTDLMDQIATLRTQVRTDANNAAKAVESELITRLQGDENILSVLSSTVQTQVPLEIETAVNEATATENLRLTLTSNALESQITSLQHQLTSLSSSVATQQSLIVNATREIASLESATGLDESAIATQRSIITNAEKSIATTNTAITALNTQITGISDTLAPIHATQQLHTNQISTLETIGLVSIPAALAVLAATLTSLKTKVDTCTVDTCDSSSPNNIKNVLEGLLLGMSDVAILAFLGGAVTEPVSVADAISPSLESVAGGAIHTLDALLSL